MGWNISIAQAVELLQHRCHLIAFDDPIDEAELRSGSATACTAILRFLFVRFSEALSKFLADAGHMFCNGKAMEDAALVQAVLDAWPTLSPHDAIGGATVDKFLLAGSWGTDRLLFTLQAVLVCARKHAELVAKRIKNEWPLSSSASLGPLDGTASTFANSTPTNHSGRRSSAEGETDGLRTTLAWMAEAYREQLQAADASAPTEGSGRAADEQARWVNALYTAHSAGNGPRFGRRSSDRRSSRDGSTAKKAEGRAGRLMPKAAQASYEEQLARAGVAHLVISLPMDGPSEGAAADDYHQRMKRLSFGPSDGLEEQDGFDDAMLNTSFNGADSVSAALSQSATTRMSTAR